MFCPARRRLLFSAALPAFLLAACAGSRRTAESAPREPDTCRAAVEVDGAIPGQTPAKTMRGQDAYGGMCLTERGLRAVARELACREGFPAVGLVNVQHPSLFWGPCYRADLDFYPTQEGFAPAAEPVVRLEPIDPTGLQVLVSFGAGPVVGGEQEETGLVSESGDKASTSKGGFHLVVRWFPIGWAGFEAETGGHWGSANAPDTKSMDFTRAWSSQLGLAFVPFQKLTLRGRFQLAVSGGLDYTRLAFADDFRDFVREKGGVVLFDDAASGFGWYAGAGVRHLTRIGFVSEAGIRYLEENPKFPEGGTLEGNQILFGFALGYRF